jgi:hypothetical protein
MQPSRREPFITRHISRTGETPAVLFEHNFPTKSLITLRWSQRPWTLYFFSILLQRIHVDPPLPSRVPSHPKVPSCGIVLCVLCRFIMIMAYKCFACRTYLLSSLIRTGHHSGNNVWDWDGRKVCLPGHLSFRANLLCFTNILMHCKGCRRGRKYVRSEVLRAVAMKNAVLTGDTLRLRYRAQPANNM